MKLSTNALPPERAGRPKASSRAMAAKRQVILFELEQFQPKHVAGGLHFRFSNESEEDDSPKNMVFGYVTPVIAARRIFNPALKTMGAASKWPNLLLQYSTIDNNIAVQ